MIRPRRILTVGHSYVVALNRRLAHEMARVGGGAWEVVAVAPRFVHGDLRPIRLESHPGELCRVEPVTAYLTSRIHLMAYGRRLRRLLSDGWDLVHAWAEPYVFSGFQMCQWTPRRTPFVFWTAQNLSKRYPPPFSWFEQYCLRRSAGWLACGQTTVDVQLARGYAAKPYRVTPLGVDVELFKPDPARGAATRRALGWEPDGPPVVGYLGRFAPEKGVPLLLQALDAVKVPWRALFVGGGPLEGQLRDWAGAFPGRVRIVTGVPHDGVPAFLNAMDVLAAPSQTTPRWREQLGRMLIEAFACGVSVVGSDSGEIPYVIGNAGRILPEADTTRWAEELNALIQDRRERAELSARGLERANRDFAWPEVARRHLEFFSELIDARSGSA